MKLLLNESQIKNLFFQYIKRYKPELLKLGRFPIRDNSNRIMGYEFTDDESLVLYFEYDIGYEGDEYPQLRITRKLSNELYAVFGDNIELIKDWFEQYYDLPVKTINYRK